MTASSKTKNYSKTSISKKGCGEDANKAKKKIDAAKTSIEKLDEILLKY